MTSHAAAFFTPALINVDIPNNTAIIRIGVWATVEDYEAGSSGFGTPLQYTRSGDDFDAFLAIMDADNKGRKVLYDKAKTDDKYSDAIDEI